VKRDRPIHKIPKWIRELGETSPLVDKAWIAALLARADQAIAEERWKLLQWPAIPLAYGRELRKGMVKGMLLRNRSIATDPEADPDVQQIALIRLKYVLDALDWALAQQDQQLPLLLRTA
jgi:hypothetical protein